MPVPTGYGTGLYFGPGGNAGIAGTGAVFGALSGLMGQQILVLLQSVMQAVANGALAAPPMGGGGFGYTGSGDPVFSKGTASPIPGAIGTPYGSAGAWGGFSSSGKYLATVANNATLLNHLTEARTLAESDAGDALTAADIVTGNGFNLLSHDFSPKGKAMADLLSTCLMLRRQGSSFAKVQDYFNSYCLNWYELDITP